MSTRGVPYGQQRLLRPDTKVTGREADKGPHIHVIANLLDNYPVIDAPIIAGQLAEILHCNAIELDASRDVPIGIRRAIRHLADAVRAKMQTPA